MEVRIFDHKDDLNKAVANEIIEHVNQQEDTILGLATGLTPIGIYQVLIQSYINNEVSFKDVITFNLDEYVGLDKTDYQSYYQFMQNELFQHIDIHDKNIHLPKGDQDVNLECQAYNHKLEKNEIDIQLLGIGSNGHIGFNEPGTPFDSITHIVKLDEKTRQDNARFFDSIEQVPTHAITMGIKNILKSKKIVLVAMGINKAAAVKAMINGPITTECPASILQLHENVVIYIDKEAASKL